MKMRLLNMTTGLRMIEIFNNGRWQTGIFRELQKGDVFRMFEPTGEPVKDGAATDFVAIDDAFLCTRLKTWTINVEPFAEGK
jgi:hypothetical protein